MCLKLLIQGVGGWAKEIAVVATRVESVCTDRGGAERHGGEEEKSPSHMSLHRSNKTMHRLPQATSGAPILFLALPHIHTVFETAIVLVGCG